MKGGVVPLTIEELEDRIVRIRGQYANRFPIQSQHEGNCASDAIQIILSFSDGIGKRFARTAIADFQGILRNRGDIYDETWVTSQLDQIPQGLGINTLFQQLGDIYRRVIEIRYLRLIDEYEERVQPTGFGLARTESQGASIERPGVRTPIGVVCSSVFAVANNRLNTPTAILARRGARNMLYGYSQENYDPIVNRVLETVAPGAKLVSGSLSHQEEGNVHEGFRGIYEPSPLTAELGRMTGVQFFFIEESVNEELGRTQRGFHTLSFFRHGGKWFIGDNEVGFAIPLPERVTTEFILSHSFSFVATAPNSRNPNTGLYEYVRTYYSHDIEIDGLLQPGEQIGLARYFLTSPTSGTYLHSYEDINGMPRKYFIPPPGAEDNWIGESVAVAPARPAVAPARPAVAPARPAVDGVLGFAEARRAAREARAASAAPAPPLGFGFPGTTAAATVTPVVSTAPEGPPGGVYGFINPEPVYVKSTEPLPSQFAIGAGLTLIARDNSQTTALIRSFMIEPGTNDLLVVFAIAPDNSIGAYKIARNAQVPTVRLRTNTGVFLAQPSDETLRWISQSLASATPAVAPTGSLFRGGRRNRKTRRARKSPPTRRRR